MVFFWGVFLLDFLGGEGVCLVCCDVLSLGFVWLFGIFLDQLSF